MTIRIPGRPERGAAYTTTGRESLGKLGTAACHILIHVAALLAIDFGSE